ncbi:MAG: NAD(P)(+) transhydrogenase (Re/Si-specific) subunit alpha, partial [Gammaproteobacteria bacterium]|nr:NAD(P)(+) transhydrogenase (Re/Si-specific) subunit alpha [Gammaproteobacteria bacterium]
MKIGIPREVHAGEKRVATTPDVAAQLQKLGFSIALEAGAGVPANYADSVYAEAGVEIVNDTREL